MRLYTIQPLRFWEEAKVRGVMTPDTALVEQDFLLAYDWMRKQMQKRLPAFSGDYPVWAWVTRPDLRRYHDDGFFGEPYVLLTVDVPKERVLVSDFNAWHFVLNTSYLTVTEEEDEFIAGLLERMKPMMPQIEASWERIFDDSALTDWCSTGDKQACVDRLYPHEVVSVTPVKQRKRKTA